MASGGDSGTQDSSAEGGHSEVGIRSRLTGGRGSPTPKGYRVAILAVAVAAALIVLVIIVVFAPGVAPPVDVYSKPSPPDDAVPSDIVPSSLGIYGQMSYSEGGGEWTVFESASAVYENGALIVVYRYSEAWYVDESIEMARQDYSELPGSLVCETSGADHWLTYSAPGDSAFMWQKDCWLFIAWAEDDETRNAAASSLAY